MLLNVLPKIECCVVWVVIGDMKDGCEVDSIGAKRWFVKGKLHREDGPAIEHANGSRYWYLKGECHRICGPAMEFSDGAKYYYQHKWY